MYQTNAIADNTRDLADINRRGLTGPELPAAAGEGVSETRVNRESLSENFNRELDAWARHALGANGFGDCP